jgi:hypothetical protein
LAVAKKVSKWCGHEKIVSTQQAGEVEKQRKERERIIFHSMAEHAGSSLIFHAHPCQRKERGRERERERTSYSYRVGVHG